MRGHPRWLVAVLPLLAIAACGGGDSSEPIAIADAGSTDAPRLDAGPIGASCGFRLGDAASQAVRDLAVGRDGRTILIGQFDGAMSVGSIALTNPVGRTSSFLLVLASDCSPLFARSFHDGIASVAVDDSGAIYLATAGVDVTKDETAFTGATFVAKLAADGTPIWSKALADSLPRGYSHTAVEQIHASADGTLLVTALLDKPSVTLADDTSIGDERSTEVLELAAVLTTDGDIRWNAWAQPTLTIGSLFGSISDAGEVALAGECTGSVVVGGVVQPCDHGFFAKVRTDGKPAWFRSGPFEGGPVAFDPSGDVVVAPKMGRASQLPTDFPAVIQTDDRLLVKLGGDNGLARWVRRTGSSPMPAAISGISGIAIDASGRIVLAGDARASAYELGGAAIANRVFVAEVDGDGVPRNSASYGDAPSTVTRPALAPDGRIVVGGALLSSADFGDGLVFSSTQWQSADAFVVSGPSLDAASTRAPRAEPPAPGLLSAAPGDVSQIIANDTGVYVRGSSALYWCAPTGCAQAEKIADGLESGSMTATADEVYVSTVTRGVFACDRSGCMQVVPDGSPVTALATDAASLYFVRDDGAYSCPLAGCPPEGAFWMTGPIAPTAIGLRGTTFYADDGHTLVACTLPACDTTRTVIETFDGNATPRSLAVSDDGVFLTTHDAVIRCPLDSACDPSSIFAGNASSVFVAGSDVYFESGHDTDALFTASISKCPTTGCPVEGPTAVAKRIGQSAALGDALFFVGDGRLSRIAR